MITIQQVNNALSIINRVNFIVSPIIKELDAYVLLDKVGQYQLIYDESQYSQYDDGSVTAITQCCLDDTSSTPWIRDEDITLNPILFGGNIEAAYQYVYHERLHIIKDYILNKKEDLMKQYKDLLGAEYLIDGYIKKGLEVEKR